MLERYHAERQLVLRDRGATALGVSSICIMVIKLRGGQQGNIEVAQLSLARREECEAMLRVNLRLVAPWCCV